MTRIGSEGSGKDKVYKKEEIQASQQGSVKQVPSQGGWLGTAVSSFLTIIVKIVTLKPIRQDIQNKKDKITLTSTLAQKIMANGLKTPILQKTLPNILLSLSLDQLKELNQADPKTLVAQIHKVFFRPNLSKSEGLNAIQTYLANETVVSTLSDRANSLIGNRIPKKRLDACLTKLSSESKNLFQQCVLAAEQIQSLRPGKWLHASDKEAQTLVQTQADFTSSIQSEENREAISILNEILDATVIWNSQLAENACLSLTAQSQSRFASDLKPRALNSPDTLYNQFNVRHTELPQNPQAEVDFKGEFEFMITGKDQLSTASFRVKFPFEGKMTADQARKHFELLSGIKTKNRFDSLCDELGIPPEKRVHYQTALQTFQSTIERGTLKAIDAIDKRNLGEISFGENSMIQRYRDQKEPTALTCLEMMQQGSIFILPHSGKLSLIPFSKRNDQQVEHYHTLLSRDFIEKGLDTFNTSKEVDVPYIFTKENQTKTAMAKGSLSTRSSTRRIGEFEFLELEITFKSKKGTLTRITQHQIPHGKSETDVIHEIRLNRQFERDLLLAQAQFIRELSQKRTTAL